jgi:hypothetical protein
MVDDFKKNRNKQYEKVFFILVAGVLFSTSMISCSKTCGHCYTNGASGPNYCSASNHVVYDAAVSSCATGGGTWVDK